MPIKYEIRYSKYMDIDKTEIKTESIFTKSFIEFIKLYISKKRNKSLLYFAIYFETNIK